MSNQPKPCPFCGNAGVGDPRFTINYDDEFKAVTCGACGAKGPFVRQTAKDASAVNAWNGRAALDQEAR